MTDAESLARVRAEFDAVAKDCGEQSFKEQLSLERCSELPYLGCVIQEALRVCPVASVSSPLYFEKDTKVGNLTVKADEIIMINIWGLHRNPNQWQRPNEFIPDRFDPASPLSRTPTGEKRKTFSWLPFNGGKRICFGKTFAEYLLKVLLTMTTQKFDTSFVDTEKYNKGSFPIGMLG
mmetsp:Transcript_2435/g.3358  ORF Transcript_2435/g.3358 Transcript_2435/m.3358 type:complete len:178 (-) Transcript_2435:21-554(-)